MIVREIGCAVGMASALLGSMLYADVRFPAQKRGDMEARLIVAAADKTAEPGHAEVTLTLTIQGPATLDVEPPHLSDATASWKEERLPSKRTVEKDRKRATWNQIIRLKQVKLGMEAPPDVSVRFRTGPDAAWEKAEWIDILKQMREEPPPPAPPPPEPLWLRRWWLPLVVGLVMLLLLAAWMVKRRRGRREAALPPDQWALRELTRIEQTLLPPQGDAEVFHTQLSHVVRRYLAERFGLHALEQTTAEFLDTIRQVPQLSAEQQTLLRELFERCDLAKFARASTPPEECRRSAELARELVRQTPAALALG